MDRKLGVEGWQTPLGPPAAPARPANLPDDAPDWWTGENADEFLAEQGVVLQ